MRIAAGAPLVRRFRTRHLSAGSLLSFRLFAGFLGEAGLGRVLGFSNCLFIIFRSATRCEKRTRCFIYRDDVRSDFETGIEEFSGCRSVTVAPFSPLDTRDRRIFMRKLAR